MPQEVTTALLAVGKALLLTILIEAPVAWLAGLRTRQGQLTLLLINCITNPLLNLLIAALAVFRVYRIAMPFDGLLIALELAVVTAEALLLRFILRLPWHRAALISFAANATSYLLGALLLW